MTIKQILQMLTRLVIGEEYEDADEMIILKVEPPAPRGRCWVSGMMQKHRFSALVFPEHALHPSYELCRSRISKLDIQRHGEDERVVNFDRGWDIHPTTKEAQEIVDFLVANLATHIFGK